MAIVLVIVFVALILKDTSYLGDSYILRGVSQGIALTAAAYWLAFNADKVNWSKYVWLLLFFFSISISAFQSNDIFFSGMQVLSLIAACLLFIAYIENEPTVTGRIRLVENVMLSSCALICVASLLAIKIKPDLVYHFDDFENIYRFRGFFSMPAMMGATASILFGVAMFRNGSWLYRMPLILVALATLYMTSSRTYWIAALGAMVIVVWWRSRSKNLVVISITIAAVIGLTAIQAVNISVSKKTAETTLRTDSLANLSGRTLAWQYAFESIQQRPLLGYGFATGDLAFTKAEKATKLSLHNGYVQAMMDAGILGASFYIALIVTAIYRIYKSRQADLSAGFYILLLLAIANLGESVMFTAAMYFSLLAWFYAIFGLSIKDVEVAEQVKPVDTTAHAPAVSASLGTRIIGKSFLHKRYFPKQ